MALSHRSARDDRLHRLRYAAVAPLSGSVIVAGGRTVSGPSRAVYRFSPASDRVTRIGSLPQPLMHAGGGALDGVMYVVGGIARDGAAVRSVLAIRPDGSVRRAATLPAPLSDAGVASLPGEIAVIGGTSGNGPTRSVLELHMGAPAASRHRSSPKPRSGSPPCSAGRCPATS